MKKQFLAFSLLLLAAPASTNYQLDSYSFGAGGVDNATSSNYAMEALLGEMGAGAELTGSNYNTLPGLLFTQMADTTDAPTVTNPANYYNKLLVEIDNASNPSDAEFAIAISDDNFTTTEYIQNDNTVGATLGNEDWQTYAGWGSGTGELVLGLEPNTTYYFKVKARHGNFTEGPWSAVSSVATDALLLSFDIDVASTDTETASPYILDLGSLSSGSVTTTSDRIWVDLNTNAESGGFVYVYGTNSGLYSTENNYTISAVTGNLTSATEGFGLQVASSAEDSGGPLEAVSPYNGSSENVGTVPTYPVEIFDTSSSPVVNGRGSFLAKAKIGGLTPAGIDYSEVLTVIAAANF